MSVGIVTASSTSNILKETIEEQAELYYTQLDDIYDNPSWYLKNLDFLKAYRVSFKCYVNGTRKRLKTGKKSKGTPTTPYGL